MFKKLIKNLKIKFFWLTLERFPNIFRPGSRPFISGDTLRNFADHIFDESKTIDVNKVKNNDVIFLNSDLIEIFFNFYDIDIKSKYILITHNSDRNISKDELNLISKNVIHWFCQNLNTNENEKVSFIPIGIENLRRLKHGRKKWIRNIKTEKDRGILCSFNVYTNYQKRIEVSENLKSHSFIEFKNFNNTNEYFKELNNFRFIICPEGNGLDTHRIWESLLLRCIPIFTENNFTNTLKEHGIPGMYLKKWGDINLISENQLIEEYESLIKNEVTQYGMFEYWKKIIESKKINS